MTFQQLFIILKSRKLLMLTVLLITVGIVMLYTLITPKKYTASASVVADIKTTDLVTGSMIPVGVSSSYISTQVDIIHSDRTSRKVVEILKLNQNPEVVESWLLETKGQGDIVQWLSDSIKQGLLVKPARESSVIQIEYTGTEPNMAANFANAFALAYLEVSLDLKVEPARQFTKFYDKHSSDARAKLEVAQKALSDYMVANEITSVDNRVDIEMAKLKEISSQLTAIQGIMTESQSKRQTGDEGTFSEVMSNPLINELKSQVVRIEGKLNEAKATYGNKHPQTKAIRAELFSMKKQLTAETDKVIASVETGFQINKQRESYLKTSLAEQKQRVLELNKQRDQILILQRDVEAAQRIYDALNQRATQTNLESQASQTNVTLLTEASIPTKPSKPNVIINLFLSFFLGTLFAIGTALFIELLNRRVRSNEDIIQDLGLPVIGEVSNAQGTIRSIQKGVVNV